jgi:methylated-DNA-protein-cysteine methyltransferase related protein
MSYDPFTQSVINIIKQIPESKVLTYGIVADMAGNSRCARQVSWILHSMSEKHNLPWWRIVNSKGIIVLKSGEGREMQRARLEKEGVEFSGDYRIDLDLSIWKSNSKKVNRS